MEQQSTSAKTRRTRATNSPCIVRLTNSTPCRAEQHEQSIIVTFRDSVILQTPVRLKVILDAGFKVLMGWILVM